MPIGSIIGGVIGAGGASAAGGAAGAAGVDAYQRALQAAGGNKALASTYLLSGNAATSKLLALYGLGHLNPFNTDGGPNSTAYGETSLNTSNVVGDRANALKDFQASPGYEWRVGQGVKTLDRSAASRGMVQSGAQQQAVTDYGQQQGSEEFGKYTSALSGIAGLGAGVTNATNNADTSALNSGNALAFQGDMGRAASYSSAANALASGIGNGLKNLVSIGAYGGSGGSFGLPKLSGI